MALRRSSPDPLSPPQRQALELWGTAMQMAWLLTESQSVISHRMMGMAGIAPQGPDEMSRMVLEKATAFSAASLAGTMLALSGRSPDAVLRGMMHPLRSTTSRNLRRLARLRQQARSSRSRVRAIHTAEGHRG